MRITAGDREMLMQAPTNDLEAWRDNLKTARVAAKLRDWPPSPTLDALINILEDEIETRAEEHLEARFTQYLSGGRI